MANDGTLLRVGVVESAEAGDSATATPFPRAEGPGGQPLPGSPPPGAPETASGELDNETSLAAQEALLREHFAVSCGRVTEGKSRRPVGRPPALFPDQKIQSLSQWHKSIVDLRIAQPGMKQGDIAAQLGKTQPWVSNVMSSDMYRAYEEQRFAKVRKEMESTIVGKATEVAEKAFDLLSERLDDPSKVSIKDAVSAAKVATATAEIGNSGKKVGDIYNQTNLNVLKVPGHMVQDTKARMVERAKELSSTRAGGNSVEQALAHIHQETEGQLKGDLGEDNFLTDLVGEQSPEADRMGMIDVTPHETKE